MLETLLISIDLLQCYIMRLFSVSSSYHLEGSSTAVDHPGYCHSPVLAFKNADIRMSVLYCIVLYCIVLYCIVLIALSRCNRVFTRRLRLCHSHTVRRREVRKGDREGLNRVVGEQ